MSKCSRPGCVLRGAGPFDGGRCRAHRPPVTIVCGAPGSGKTSYVDLHRSLGDVVWDFDAIMAAVCGRLDEKVPGALDLVLSMRNAFLRVVRDDLYVAPFTGRAWFIESLPRRRDRDARAKELGAEVVLLQVPKDECLQRIAARRRGDAHAVCEWFNHFQP